MPPSSAADSEATAVEQDLPPPSLQKSLGAMIKGKSLRANTPHTLPKRPWRRIPTSFAKIEAADYEGSGTEEDPYIVEWLPKDYECPLTWGNHYKWFIVMLVATATLAVALASSAYSGATTSLEQEFGSSNEVIVLGLSLFVLGFALGPLIWAPLGEVLGRRNLFIFTYTMFTLFNGVGAASQNMASVIVFRFFAGAFGSSPLVNSGGTISDMFEAKQRGLAMSIFASAPFTGPAIGPVIGGFIGGSAGSAGWRWVQAFLALFSGALTLIGAIWIPETYAPVLLRRRAARLSEFTGKVYRAPQDAKGLPELKKLFAVALSRPWKLLFREPIVLLLSIYMAIVYGTLYLLFGAFPIVFQQQRGWSSGVGGLAFMGVLVGMLSGVGWVVAYDNPRYIRVADAKGGRADPEDRLPPAILGSVALTIGLAWFAGTCQPSVHWIVPIMAGAPFGFGMVLVFLALMNYLIDSYLLYAASVLAANAVLRSLFGAIFPLFTSYMYANLGVNWASSIPAFLSLACLPFPILFYRYGAPIRKRCKFAAEADQMLQKMLAKRDDKASPHENQEAKQEKKQANVDEGEQQTRKLSPSGSSDDSAMVERPAEKKLPPEEQV